MNVVAVIVAAGRGNRAGEGLPKQYRSLGGQPVLTRTLEAFLLADAVDAVICAIHPHDAELYREATAAFGQDVRLLPPVPGGRTRQESVRLALGALEGLDRADDPLCLVHDAARPFVDTDLILRAIAAGREHGRGHPGPCGHGHDETRR
jgi:2-C-methyl-D-erythritol 4-phosphate cytidylyltransferase/2-C-methyl-D-erythritol 2,4-cyclodiphosphate synthase